MQISTLSSARNTREPWIAIGAAALLVFGCSNMDEDTGRRAGTAAAVGAITGGVIGSFSGNWGAGAAAGAAIGGASGYLYDQVKKDNQ